MPPLFKDKPDSQQLHAIIHFKDFFTPAPPPASQKNTLLGPEMMLILLTLILKQII